MLAQYWIPFIGVPGYTGFIPESDHNALACYEASGVQQPRHDGKAATMLFTLDQYSRQRVPLYTGHRPTALSNLSVQEPAHGPSLQTTQVTKSVGLPGHLVCLSGYIDCFTAGDKVVNVA